MGSKGCDQQHQVQMGAWHWHSPTEVSTVLFDFIIQNLDAGTDIILSTSTSWRHPWYPHKFLYHHLGEA